MEFYDYLEMANDAGRKQMKQRIWAGLFAAFVAGVFIGGLVVFVVLDRGVHQIADSADQSIAALKGQSAAWETTARECTAQFSIHTLLIEDLRAEQGTSPPVPGVLGFLLQSLNQQSSNRSMSLEGWYIPAKITPVAYGKGERRYWWFDPKAKKLDGPYIPLRNTGLVQ